ncbi:MAG: AAA family ATPase, partial [Candidatus Krumholzibacteriota bacterium]|nr:AAA family ATPase [Candidatus Krumholzibacteriota bacterium]
MNLSKLEISGFKSFMSRIELDFSNGITAILGPNGCGKSNVVDAIRWALGEQRTRILRNTKMENVLFNGTRLRKPLGMAEVQLTLVNDDHTVNLEHDEITIGRRLYRDGSSEYLINGKAARLKDLRSLLIDTGLGNSVYSIIERDMIERVLSEKGQEKRHLLEEAAGVSRYRIQREEAERKITATEYDLLRLVDILQEIEKELRSLKYQMGKARRYKSLKETADALETVMLKATLHDLIGRRHDLLREKEQHEGIRLADANEISIQENRLQEMRVRTAEFERRIQGLGEKRYQLSSELQQYEERIAVHNERITSSRTRITDDKEEMARASEKLAGLADELVAQRADADEKRERLSSRRTRLGEMEASLRAVSQSLRDARDMLRSRKQFALDLVRRKAEEKGALDHIEQTVEALSDKQDTIESQLDDLSSEETKRVGELTSIETSAQEQHEKLTGLQNDLTRLSENIDRVGDESARCDTEYGEAHRLHAKLTEKKKFL